MHMKKFTISIAAILLFTVSIFAQNLIENPGFETWNAGNPDPWAVDGGAIVVSQNTTDFQEGASSCQVIFTSQENQYFASNTMAVTAGDPIAAYFYAYDNDLAGRTRLCVIFDAGDNYYGDYSEDMDSWQMISYEGIVPDGATQATLQLRFYDVAANWVDDCEILIDQASFIIDNAVKPEPSNYPTDFAISPNGAAAIANWTDATGDQLPQKYLVYASATNSFSAPVDGAPVADDADMSDGSAVLNIAFGAEAASFGGLTPATAYYFTIYPYTNDGTIIDYKTDGTAPTAEIVMPDVSIINFVDFEDLTFGEWTTYSVLGDQVWEIATYGNPNGCAKMSGYSGEAYNNEDWLISPAFDLDDYANEVFTFESAMNYEGPAMEFLLSSDYSSGDPTAASWEAISFTPSEGGWAWQPSGAIDLSSYTGVVHLAYKFTSTSDGSATWEVDNILFTGTMESSVSDQNTIDFRVFPNPSNGIYKIENNKNQAFEISVFNLLGEQLMETINTNSHYNLDIQDFDNGVYFLQIMSEQQKKTVSIIKN